MHGISPIISGGTSPTVLANGTVSAINVEDEFKKHYEFTQTLAALYAPQQQTVGHIKASVHGKPYLSQAHTVAKQDAVSIATVLRTHGAWVDRVKVRVAYQLNDASGSSVVNQPSSVQMELGAPLSSGGSPGTSTSCSLTNTQVGIYTSDRSSSPVTHSSVCSFLSHTLLPFPTRATPLHRILSFAVLLIQRRPL